MPTTALIFLRKEIKQPKQLKHIISSYLFFYLILSFFGHIFAKNQPIYPNAESLRQNYQGDHGFRLHDP
jgi:hypothetical protein